MTSIVFTPDFETNPACASHRKYGATCSFEFVDGGVIIHFTEGKTSKREIESMMKIIMDQLRLG